MKKAVLLLMGLAIFFSCRKEQHLASAISSGKKSKVVFSISNFAQFRANFAVNQHHLSLRQHNLADSVVALDASGMDVLYYYVFDSFTPGSVTVHKVFQDSTFCDQFGIITDSLTAGHHYTIFFAAGKKGLIAQDDADEVHTAIGYGGLNWQDLFVYLTQIDVPATPSTYNVTLHRQVSKLELQVLDTIPANAKTIKMAVVNESSAFIVGNQTIDGGVTDTGFTYKTIPASAIGKPDFMVDRIQGSNQFYLDVYISAVDASDHVLAKVKVPGVKCNPNQKTILSGKLFGNSSTAGQSFTVKIDTAWAGTKHQSF